jgi:hypothetical protein
VDAGEARSQNELVERALRRELRAIRQRRLYEEYGRAAQNPAFTDEMTRVARDWSATLGDGLPEEDP